LLETLSVHPEPATHRVAVHARALGLPDVEVLAKMEQLNPGGSLKDRPVLRMLLSAVARGQLQPVKTILDRLVGQRRHRLRDDRPDHRLPGGDRHPGQCETERKTRLAHGARLIFTDAIPGSEDRSIERHARGPVSRGDGGAGRRRPPPGPLLDPKRGRRQAAPVDRRRLGGPARAGGGGCPRGPGPRGNGPPHTR
jgi:hypothetical protein